jgi:hypothetical protein
MNDSKQKERHEVDFVFISDFVRQGLAEGNSRLI